MTHTQNMEVLASFEAGKDGDMIVRDAWIESRSVHRQGIQSVRNRLWRNIEGMYNLHG